jgi:hypothetical protein
MTASNAASPFIPHLYPAAPPANPAPAPSAFATTSRGSAGAVLAPIGAEPSAIADVQPLPTATHLAAHAVSSQFATRPSVRSVVREMLGEAIKSLYPTLELDVAQTSVAEPIAQNPVQYRLTPLLDVALNHLAAGAEIDFTDKYSWPQKLVKQGTGTTLRVPHPSGDRRDDIDMSAIELVIRSLRPSLRDGFARALTRYWGQSAGGATGPDAGNRWLWLSGMLSDSLRSASLKQPGLTDAQRATLDQVVAWPERAQRVSAKGDDAARVFVLDSTVRYSGGSSTQLSPDLLITRQIGGSTQVLHAAANGLITPYDSVEAFGKAWGETLENDFVFDNLTWKRQEPDANIFDTQAGIILNNQLQAIDAIELPEAGGLNALEQRFSLVSDPSPWFVGAYAPDSEELARLQKKLPQWMRNADPADRFAYHRHALELASDVQRNHGRNFFSDIPDIRAYTQQQLQAQLENTGFLADHLEVTFKVPVGTLGGGYIERVTMSLTDMALRNLAGLPKGEMEVRHFGQLITDPAMPQRLKDIVKQVDIGKNYPALLHSHLLGDSDEAHRRSALFAQQVPLQLAMQALELKLKGEAGITARGYQYVAAVLSPGAGAKQVDGQDIVIRPLAFLRKPGATPDVVQNMFVIEPADSVVGPHILYRPMLSPALQAFTTRQALLEAVQQPGPLQQSVLAWLPDDRTRAVYGNGGFKTPNIARYSVFNEFDPPAQPAPTALAVDGYDAARTLRQDLEQGRLMQHLYQSNTHSLVSLAEGQSVSDAQSRWASFKELGGLLFNTLLPVLRGPGAMAGWLLQLAGSEDDIRKLSNPTAQDDSTATVVDLLLNMGMVLTHSAPADAAQPLVTLDALKAIPQNNGPTRRVPGQTPSAHRTTIRQSSVEPTAGVVGDNATVLDFAFSSPRRLTAGQLAQIESFRVPAPADVGAAIAEGQKRGLYLSQGRLYANIDNQWFRVANDLDGVFIIDENNRARTGPPIRRDAQGRWSFDSSPRLRGGMPRKSGVAERVKQNTQAKQARGEQFSQAVEAALVLDGPRVDAHNQLVVTITDYHNARKKLRTLWGLSTTGEHQQRFLTPYFTQLELTQNLRQTIDQQFVQLKQSTQAHSAAVQTAIDSLAPKKLGAVDDLSEEKQARSNLYGAVLDNYRQIEQFYRALAEDSNQHVPSGRSMAEVVSEARTGSKSAYIELMDNFGRVYHDLENVREAALVSAAVVDKWTNDSSFGKTKAEHFLKLQDKQPPAIIALRMKLTTLSNLKELSLDRYARTTDPVESFYLQRLSSTNLIPVYRAHLDLRQYSGYSLSERKATLETIIGTYQRELSDSLAIQDANPSLQRAEYQQLFAERLRDVINDAQTDLAEVIREEQALVPVAVARIDQQQKPAGQRTFKTRDKETLIGTARPHAAGASAIIDVLDPQSGQPVASYSEHPSDGEWVKIVPAQPVRPAQSPKSLSTLKSDARKLLEESAGIERTIEFQKRKLNDPQRREGVNPLDWNDMLQAQAERLQATALQAETNQSGRPETAQLVNQWRTAADELLHKARQHCADGYKLLPPKPENIDYLWKHGFVDINLVQRDTATKSGDVFTEYAVREKGKVDVLWYAHFHYPAKGSPRNLYTAAHLKIPSQRTKTQKDLVAEAGNNRVVEQIVRSRIGPPLDEKLFLTL